MTIEVGLTKPHPIFQSMITKEYTLFDFKKPLKEKSCNRETRPMHIEGDQPGVDHTFTFFWDPSLKIFVLNIYLMLILVFYLCEKFTLSINEFLQVTYNHAE